LIDENHAAQTDDMFQVLKSGQAMRENPLAIVISSGGYLMDGFPFYERISIAHQQL
jgi:phage terminase large subunit-like protein